MRIESVIILLAATLAPGQTNPAPAWKEFSIGAPTANRTRFGPDGMRAEGVPLKRVLARAFGLPEHRIIGPSWIADERYAITAVVNDPKEFQPLLQQELNTRFHMLAHREMKDVPVYEIRTIEGASVQLAPVPASAKGVPGASLRLNSTSVRNFADTLADAIQRPVFDETHLDAKFDFALTWQSTDPASLKTAVKNQLGLDLVESRRVVDVLVVDHIEKALLNP